MKPTNKMPEFKSIFANKLHDFLQFKRAIGYKYISESKQLVRFDKFCILERIDKLELDEQTVLKWTAKRDGEKPKTHFTRSSILRQFVLYLNKNEISAALPHQIKKSAFSKFFTPYIFTHEQIANLISQADKLPRSTSTSKMYLIFPILLRLLYGCGLRVSEALKLYIGDLDLKRGVITIRESKNDNNRLVPMSRSLNSCIKDYLDRVHPIQNDDDFVFQTSKKEQYSTRTVYQEFRKVLWQCEISHGGRGKGPRLHDVRHTFSVHSLQKWIYEKRDTYVLLPILSTYLGHKNIYATEKYLRLTSEMYPDVLEKVRVVCENIIPEVVDYETY
jgi:integrase/recombinase XerD